jgi:hypothetical protein
MLVSNGRLLPWVLPFDIKARAVPWNKIIIAWQEWLALPDLGVQANESKIDTGVCTSALHTRDCWFSLFCH